MQFGVCAVDLALQIVILLRQFLPTTTGGCSGKLPHACTPISAWVAGRGRIPWCDGTFWALPRWSFMVEEFGFGVVKKA